MPFSFENCARNESLSVAGLSLPNPKKTGTTICAVIYRDGVVLGADTRATGGTIVAEKLAPKIHYLADNMHCCGAGTSADTNKVTRMIASQLELHRLLTGKQVPVIAATRMIRQHLFQYQGHIGAALILGGVDSSGSYIYNISPHGNMDKIPYTASGSGCLAAFPVLEQRWKPGMELEDAKKLVRDAIAGGVFYDLGSGNNINMLVVNKDGYKLFDPYEIGQARGPKEKSYRFKPKSSAIITRNAIPIKIENTTVRQLDVEPMDVL